ncbi:hypothetical protein P9112_000825 [Eukaryota sp. TZLM1-RC]
MGLPDEKDVLQFWEDIDAFHTLLEKTKDKPLYTFYDGPPFATGQPHYGHILISVLKDVVVRYFTMKGHYIPRNFGWDTHGLPIEHEVDKLHGIHGEADVQAMGIGKYNDICRSIVMRCREDWEHVISRIGRWIEFKNDYKTMDPSFMESVWWVFSELWKKDLVYRGTKVMPWSTGLQTSLSNFEANQNYKDVEDPAIYVTFPLVDDPEVSLLAWTTTPWTLPSNLALVVHPEMEYVRIVMKETGQKYILAQALLNTVFPIKKSKKKEKVEPDYEIESSFVGSTLKGKQYIPLFPYFKSRPSSFYILVDGYVTSETGTGVVHAAPGFGEDDARVCLEGGITGYDNPPVCPINGAGEFTKEVGDYCGQYVKDADKSLIAELKANGRLFRKGTITHSYPFCWRSETPLLYRAVPSWFVKVTELKEKLLVNNLKSKWVPENIQEGRFHNWLRDSRDWAISRSRFFGTPLPIWTNEDFSEIVVVSSVEELYKLSGVRVTDLHRDHVDDITIPSKSNPGSELRRIPEVFDCWFESGSMPYASKHYPFTNPESFQSTFPADFVAEAMDQTRGWFYTMLVLSTALFDSAAFKNLVVTGLVLAEDGRKMSKRLKNYPDPLLVVKDHGADALRLYLINSQVMKGESLRFRKVGVEGILRDVLLPWFNSFKFLTQNIDRFNQNLGEFVVDTQTALKSDNIFDKWIISSLNSLISFIRTEMESYRVYCVVPQILNFVQNLSNWYVRLNRDRIRGALGVEEARLSLQTLFYVVFEFNLCMAPFACFLTEHIYQELGKYQQNTEQSVHFLEFPTVMEHATNQSIEKMIERMQDVIIKIRTIRDRNKLPVKQPLSQVVVIHTDNGYIQDIEATKQYIMSETNLENVLVTTEEGEYVRLSAKPNFKALGPKLGKNMKKVGAIISNMTHDDVSKLRDEGQMERDGFVLTLNDVLIQRSFTENENQLFEALPGDEGSLCLLNLKVTPELLEMGKVREVVSFIQKLRKTSGLTPENRIEVFVESNDFDLLEVIKKHSSNRSGFVFSKLKCGISNFNEVPKYLKVLGEQTVQIEESSLRIVLCAATPIVSNQILDEFPLIAKVLPLLDYESFTQNCIGKSSVNLTLNGSVLELTLGRDLFLSMIDVSN